MNITQHLRNEVVKNAAHIPLSGVTAYHLLSGSLALANSVITSGFATTLHTGNGTTQSVVTGVDMSTQWGNDASETFGGLVWAKSRSYVNNNNLCDTIRGANNFVYSDLTNAQGTVANRLTAFTNDGFTLGSESGLNTNLATYASWVFQTTHRISGTTNHGKAYTCHYNPFTGFTMVKYEGSGIAGHEIPHHLGRKLGFVTTKSTTDGTMNWRAWYGKDGYGMFLNATNAEVIHDANGGVVSTSIDVATYTSGLAVNASANQYIMYGWANSYYDEANTLQGNYEIGIYQGSGLAGNKVTTRGKPAWLMRKRIDTTGNWNIQDNLRSLTLRLFANLSNADSVADLTSFVQDGFICNDGGSDTNASGGQYLYMVVYDNDSGSGKSKYPRATDTSTLNLNAIIPFANGIDSSGTKNTVLTKNETVSGLTLTQGKNYVYSTSAGVYGVKSHSPKYNTYNGFGEYFDTNKNQWFNSPSIFSDDFSTDTGWLLTGATKTVANSTLTLANSGAASGYASKAFSTVAGTRYKLVGKYSLGSSAGASVLVGTTQNGLEVASQTYTVSSDVAITFVATGTTTYVSVKNTGATTGLTSTFNDFAVYPVQGDGSVDISGATTITESRNYLDAIVYADQNGQPAYVEQLPKIEYKDVVKANEFQGKNACTAWALVDMATTPPTILDSFNISIVVRTANGFGDAYFKTNMDSLNYTMCGGGNIVLASEGVVTNTTSKSLNKIGFCVGVPGTAAATSLAGRNVIVEIHIFGGKQ